MGMNRSKPAAASVEGRRAAMPVVAEFIDMCRRAYGAAMVDQQMATAQQAWREHAQVLERDGEAAAQRWLLKNAHRCTFFAQEGGRELGLRSPYGRSDAAATAEA